MAKGREPVPSTAFALPDRALVLDRYRPLRPIGRGGSGSVWLARDEQTGLDVALKIVPREGKRAARAAREMEAASRLRHERCVRAYDFGTDDGHAYIAYEYVRGRTLRELDRHMPSSDQFGETIVLLEVDRQIGPRLSADFGQRFRILLAIDGNAHDVRSGRR